MDWNVVIERNRERLKGILAALAAMAGLGGKADPASPSPLWGGDRGVGTLPGGSTLPRHLHRAVMRLLRPAEAAARRLVIIAARDLVLPPPKPRKPRPPKPPSIFVRPGERRTGIVLPYGVKPGDILPNLAPPRKAPTTLSLPLFDTLPEWPGSRRRPVGNLPRIWSPGFPDRAPARRPPLPDDAIDTKRLALRLGALARALDDLPREARRFALWRARRDAASAQISQALDAAGVQLDPRLYGAGARSGKTRGRRFLRMDPLRSGLPPGSCKRSRHEVHEVLKDLHYFAVHALERSWHDRVEQRPDTS